MCPINLFCVSPFLLKTETSHYLKELAWDGGELDVEEEWT